jgi:Flp pilus assembly pilin Flp
MQFETTRAFLVAWTEAQLARRGMLTDDRGVTLVEYALLFAAIVVFALAALIILRAKADGYVNRVPDAPPPP